MSPDDISQLRERQKEQDRLKGIAVRHATFASAYGSLQKCLKEAGDQHVDLSDPHYLKTTGMGYGLWKLERTKLFKATGDGWLKSWCGRHRLYISNHNNFNSKIHIRLSR